MPRSEFECARVIRGDGGDMSWGGWRGLGESGGNSSVDCSTSGDIGPLVLGERMEVAEAEDIVLTLIGGGGCGAVCWGRSGG